MAVLDISWSTNCPTCISISVCMWWGMSKSQCTTALTSLALGSGYPLRDTRGADSATQHVTATTRISASAEIARVGSHHAVQGHSSSLIPLPLLTHSPNSRRPNLASETRNITLSYGWKVHFDILNRGVARGGFLPRHHRSIFVTAPLVFSRVSIFCPWTPLGTSVPRPLVCPP